MPDGVEKLVIVGSGPAGHTAAIYSARADLSPLMFEGFMAGGVAAGGQLTTTNDVENYPGFPQGVNGPEMMDLFRQQSLRFGARILTETVDKVDLSQRPFRLITSSGGNVGRDADRGHGGHGPPTGHPRRGTLLAVRHFCLCRL